MVYLLTGSNIGDSILRLKEAIKHIERNIGEVIQVSSLYKTAPWGNTNQQDFINQVILVSTLHNPEKLLEEILVIEKIMGRVRTQKWAPREIDIDILFYDQLIYQTEQLQIPHPLLHQRLFTLLPLHEIAPELIHPVFNQTIEALLNACEDEGKVEKL
ncbi:MAG: 2-amino-4-hydroxy-6-hydroxymethyldihydropteridine diphosphokinase [Bacteroidia bacterium]|jgi:2-amino-4-hydroxy-6-hydroxymethyldihydropteridine diphosphokinase|nr:2-amino-4-hydroxy-6-hydroxymethyldihydropteridine diphosphokinase [Bacteroidia bacterium]